MNFTANTIRSSLRNFLCGIVVGTLCIAPTFSTNAESLSKGQISNMSNINGYSYTAQNTIVTGLEGSSSYKYARAYTNINANTNVPGGFMGVYARLFDSAGNAVSITDWYYNPSNRSGISNSAELLYLSGTPAYRSQGYVKVWNGTDYWTYNTFATPYLNDYTS